MTDPKPAREWWIEQTLVSYAIGEPVYRVLDKPQTLLQERTSVACFHVVEYSALQRAEAEIAELKERYEQACDSDNAWRKAAEELKLLAESYRTILEKASAIEEHYHEHGNYHDFGQTDEAIEEARKVLGEK